MGERLAQRTLLEGLVAGGYDPAVEVTGIGEFAHRGGLVDIWPPGATEPVRIELWGDEVDSIRAFDPMTQGSRRKVDAIELLPASEFLPADGWDAAIAGAPIADHETLQEDAAKLAEGDVAEAAETWVARLTAGPASDPSRHRRISSLLDDAELGALGAEIDAQAGDRRDALVARRASCRTTGRCPTTRPPRSPTCANGLRNGSRRGPTAGTRMRAT